MIASNLTMRNERSFLNQLKKFKEITDLTSLEQEETLV